MNDEDPNICDPKFVIFLWSYAYGKYVHIVYTTDSSVTLSSPAADARRIY